MLRIANLQKTFNPGTINAKTALRGLDLTLENGDFVTVIGGNGARYILKVISTTSAPTSTGIRA